MASPESNSQVILSHFPRPSELQSYLSAIRVASVVAPGALSFLRERSAGVLVRGRLREVTLLSIPKYLAQIALSSLWTDLPTF